VFSNAALHWVLDHEQLLQRVRVALRPGGMLRFNFAGHGNCSNFNKTITAVMSIREYEPYFKGFQWPWYMPAVREYERIVSGSGLRDIRVWEENADRFFPDAEAIIRWIDQPSLVPFLERIAPCDKVEFRERFIGRMLAVTRQDDGTYLETFRRINVSARK